MNSDDVKEAGSLARHLCNAAHGEKVAEWCALRQDRARWASINAALEADAALIDDPKVRLIFADAIAVRRWIVDHKAEGWQDVVGTSKGFGVENLPDSIEAALIPYLVYDSDRQVALIVRDMVESGALENIGSWVDYRGNNFLWYLTYRDEVHPSNAFGCPETAKLLIELGVDPNHQNDLGLCWNDVAEYYISDTACTEIVAVQSIKKDDVGPSYHVCAKCGYTDKGLPKPPQTGGFKPLCEKCPKCGENAFFLHNIAWV